MLLLTTALILIAAPQERPVVLENGHIRLELAPQTFSVRFVGFPGGKNFLDPIYLTESAIAGDEWVEPGGMTTDLLPPTENSALLRRGPAEVVTHEPRYVLLLGPENPDTNWRIKKEYTLEPDAPEVRYKATILSSRKEERRAGLRITAQVRGEGQFLVARAPGALGLMLGHYPGLQSLQAGEQDAFTVPITGVSDRHRAVLTAPAPSVTLQTSFGTWTRTLDMPSQTGEAPEGERPRLVLLLDDRTHTYQAGLEGMQSGVNVGAPLVAVERWVFSTAAAPLGESR